MVVILLELIFSRVWTILQIIALISHSLQNDKTTVNATSNFYFVACARCKYGSDCADWLLSFFATVIWRFFIRDLLADFYFLLGILYS